MNTRTRCCSAAVVLWGALVAGWALAPSGARGADPDIVRKIADRARKVVRRATTRPATRPTTQPVKVEGIQDCAALYRKGKYAEAASGYRKLLKGKAGDVRLTTGLARALMTTGEYDKALGALDQAGKVGETYADWLLVRAELLRRTGKYTEALAAAEKANKLRPKWAPTLLARGMILETLGRKKDAIAVYQTMDAIVSGDGWRDDARVLVALGQIMERHSVLTGRTASEQAPNILHNYLQRAYQEADEGYWPAHVAAGQLLLNKHRAKTAATEFGLALKKNRYAVGARVGMGSVLLSMWQFEKAIQQVDAALKVNPKLADALLLKAVVLMQWRKFEQVPPVLNKVLKTNPADLDALSLMAAVYIRTYEGDKAKPFIARVKKVNAKYAGLPYAIGEWLSSGRQFEMAEKYLKEAIALAPEEAGPVAALGRVYMQTGQEDKAREVLTKAREIDDYRQDVYNYRKLLAKMEHYKTVETEHFLFTVDPKYDEVLLGPMTEYAEQMAREVCRDFDYTPPVKTRVQIFPAHDEFSIRISGRGWIGTIGASTGNVIAMVAPSRERSQFGTFNWTSVLRHEYTHTVTLAATKNRIPHWFTEACAVWQQPDRRSYDAVKRLVAATRMGRLMPVKELDWGFIRPKRRGDRGLAYAEAEWIMEYIIETKGYDSILGMLHGFRDGETQKEVFDKVLGTTEAKFDKAFRTWAGKQIEAWGYRSDPVPDLRKATKAAKDNPKDAKAQAGLAVALYLHRQAKSAEKAARKALEIDPKNQRALAVLANIQLVQKKYGEAIKTARKLDSIASASKTAPRVLAKCYEHQRQWKNAIEQLEHLKQRMPLDPYAFERLATLYTQLGDIEKALPDLMELHRRTMKDAQYARRIAEAYRTMGKDEMALRYFKEIAYINPYEASAYEAIAAIHRNARRYNKAVEAVHNVCLLQPNSADAWAKMAMMRYLAGKAAKSKDILQQARKEAEKSIELDPESQAKTIIEYIDAVMESLDDN